MPAPDVTLLVAHGSRNPRTAADHTALCNAVAAAATDAAGPSRVLPAFLEITEPSIGDAIDDAVEGGATSITVLPLFVHVGNHVERDIPAIVDEARARHPGVHVVLRPHIGAGADFVELVARAVVR
ncbi:sirohydrochlorin chelatase [Dermatobacter hominis]|uniref:sirohydrochlorin chelatase n=1 Tax=Dermatobacter hominis TaxID=2884263 RepID=UPI001D12DBF4|nr:CbiX/SirB N-terminal domain-containing protein [Dermatobacter hominis]UDY37357.1 CbiX/SirB N-terminal domain-containing protein [Dermatobacter hominis]